jgi:transcriptional regulator with XRE-family HTH domain
MPRKKADTFVPVGKKIKKERTRKKISLGQVANETGCSTDYLKQLESGESIPPVGTLLQIARALSIDSGYLLREQGAGQEKRERAYAKRTKDYAYKTLTPGAENKHLKAFQVVIDPLQEHKGVGYQHEGEEFIYLVAGKIEVIVGDHANILKKGESLHFNSGIRHQIRNLGKTAAEMLVVVYAP